MADLFDEPMYTTVEEKKDFLQRNHIALWDVFASCEIKGAEDSSIRNEVPNNLERIFSSAEIKAVFTNGQKASSAYKKYFSGKITVPWIALPSTSPANCRNWTYETLRDAYRVILEYV